MTILEMRNNAIKAYENLTDETCIDTLAKVISHYDDMIESIELQFLGSTNHNRYFNS
jgi:hypothetical protein